MIKCYGNSLESAAHSLVDPDLKLKKFFYVGLLCECLTIQPSVVNFDSNVSRNGYKILSSLSLSWISQL